MARARSAKCPLFMIGRLSPGWLWGHPLPHRGSEVVVHRHTEPAEGPLPGERVEPGDAATVRRPAEPRKIDVGVGTFGLDVE